MAKLTVVTVFLQWGPDDKPSYNRLKVLVSGAKPQDKALAHAVSLCRTRPGRIEATVEAMYTIPTMPTVVHSEVIE